MHSGPPVAELLAKARTATTALRNATRDGRALHGKQRDPLVAAIHNALDELERLSS